MDLEEMRAKSVPELRAELVRLRRERFELRMQQQAGQLSRNHLFGQTQREIARVQTVIREIQGGRS